MPAPSTNFPGGDPHERGRPLHFLTSANVTASKASQPNVNITRTRTQTEAAGHHAASSVRLDISPELRVLAQIAPGELLKGETPRAVDEWQLAPDLWNAADGQH